jgi:hypothetical protein
MARNRMLNPDFWLDEEIGSLTPFARLLYMGLWGICDDNYATLPDRPEWIKLQILPYDSVNPRQLLDELEKIGKIIKFQADGKPHWFIKNFFKHQRIDRPSKPKYPKYSSARVMLDEPSTTTRRKGSKERKISNKEIPSEGGEIANPEFAAQFKKGRDLLAGKKTL